MIIKCETDSNIKVLNNLIIISNKLIRNVLLIMSKYRVKFLNCIRRVARKYGEFRLYIINKKIPIHGCDSVMLKSQNGLLVGYTFKI